MTQEKDLLLRDLCTRLPHNPIVYVDENLPRLKLGAATRVWEYVAVDKPCKPYLRPMSSMTEEEKKEFESFGWRVDELDDNYPWVHIGQIENVLLGLNWLNAHHFDYRGLIEKGLAIEAPKEMYK